MTLFIQHFDDCKDLHQLHVANPQRYPFLLETVAHGSDGDQYDILFACPGETLMLDEAGVLQLSSKNSGEHNAIADGNFLDAFDHYWGTQHVDDAFSTDIPFAGGWFVYLGYEIAQQIEPSLKLPKCNDGLPIAFATRIFAALIRDHKKQQIIAVAEPGCRSFFKDICNDFETIKPDNSSVQKRKPTALQFTEEQPPTYLDAVKQIKQYIREGDVFQVNLSRRWHATLDAGVDHNQLYKALRKNNPAPFFALVTFPDTSSGNFPDDNDTQDMAIISSSPERLVRVRGNSIETRPIAGTRPRGQTNDSDVLNQKELLAHPKERAEHIMLIDLERNDLGRVCESGSINVSELMVLESYSHVHHIVSSVTGTLRKGTLPGHVLRAVFPGGTITGCPKVRCMEIIAELEGEGRGAYTGSVGYVTHNGDMDFNILIRSMVKNREQLSFRAGAGIVADSKPETELEETRAKAMGLLLTLDSE